MPSRPNDQTIIRVSAVGVRALAADARLWSFNHESNRIHALLD
jgi:hypothetical protein